MKFHIRISKEFRTEREKFQGKQMSIHLEKNRTLSHKNEPSFRPWQ